MVEKLTELQGLGMTYAITYFVDAAYDRSSIELFEREVALAAARLTDDGATGWAARSARAFVGLHGARHAHASHPQQA